MAQFYHLTVVVLLVSLQIEKEKLIITHDAFQCANWQNEAASEESGIAGGNCPTKTGNDHGFF
jgi:hypothetical protein